MPVQVPGLVVMQVVSADVLRVEGTSCKDYARVLVVANTRPKPVVGPLPEGALPCVVKPFLGCQVHVSAGSEWRLSVAVCLSVWQRADFMPRSRLCRCTARQAVLSVRTALTARGQLHKHSPSFGQTS